MTKNSLSMAHNPLFLLHRRLERYLEFSIYKTHQIGDHGIQISIGPIEVAAARDQSDGISDIVGNAWIDRIVFCGKIIHTCQSEMQGFVERVPLHVACACMAKFVRSSGKQPVHLDD